MLQAGAVLVAKEELETARSGSPPARRRGGQGLQSVLRAWRARAARFCVGLPSGGLKQHYTNSRHTGRTLNGLRGVLLRVVRRL